MMRCVLQPPIPEKLGFEFWSGFDASEQQLMSRAGHQTMGNRQCPLSIETTAAKQMVWMAPAHGI